MDSLPKISVITPSFNQGEFLEHTILSVLNQNYRNLEYILLDGGSTDDSPKIIQKYKKHFTYWRIAKDKGQSHAIEEGLNRSTGDIQCWLNSDDFFLPGTLNFVGSVFNKYPTIQWITGQPVCSTKSGELIQSSILSGRLSFLIKHGLYHGKCLGFLQQESTFWRKEVWQSIGSKMPSYSISSDYWLWKTFAQHADVVSIEGLLSAFRLNPQQKTSNMSSYYHSIHPIWNYIPKKLTLLNRLLHPLLLRHISPRLQYDYTSAEWRFSPGAFYNPELRQ